MEAKTKAAEEEVSKQEELVKLSEAEGQKEIDDLKNERIETEKVTCTTQNL